MAQPADLKTYIDMHGGLPSQSVHQIVKDSDGKIWALAKKSIFRWQRNGFMEIPIIGLKGSSVFDLANYNGAIVEIGAEPEVISLIFLDDKLVFKRAFTVQLNLCENLFFYYAIALVIGLIIFLVIKNIHDRKTFKKKLLANKLSLHQQNFNPHFIYNTLNLVYGEILENDKTAAAETFMEFSKLHRIFLDRSREKKITLKEELNFVGLYYSLEKKRFKHDQKFDYVILNDAGLNLDLYNVPPNFLQPILENALKHGILGYHGQENPTILIELIAIKQGVLLRVENPININRKTFNKVSTNLGQSIVEERIALFNQEMGTKISIQFGLSALHFKSGYRVDIIIAK